MPEAASPRESLAEMLTIRRIREGRFSATLEDFFGAAQGADLLARAALAASEGVGERPLRSLHACLLRAAAPGLPLALDVERLGGDADTEWRQVRIEADGRLGQVQAGFASAGAGIDYQDVAPEPDLPAPEDLPSTLEQARAEGWSEYARGPIEFRRALPRRWPAPGPAAAGAHVEWVRPRVPLPDDPRLQMAALVFLGAFYSHWAFERRLGPAFAQVRFTPLDHAHWAHRTLRWDDWWLLRATSEVSHAGRALGRREIYTREGLLVASTVQTARIASA